MKPFIISIDFWVINTENRCQVIINSPVKLPIWLIKELEEFDSGDETKIDILVYSDMIILTAFGCGNKNIHKINNNFFKQLNREYLV